MLAEDFIISRKRKKYKFAKFAEMDNCYEADQFTKSIRDSFAKNNELIIEIGAGNGLFLVELARRSPYLRFIAVDVKADRLYSGACTATALGLDNIIFVRSHALELLNILQRNSVQEIWLTFSDPFPKNKQVKHRMTHPSFLQIYRKILRKYGILHFKTDNQLLFCWSLEQFVAANMKLSNLTFDLHKSKLAEPYKIMTTYENRFVSEGLAIHHVDASFSA